MALTQSKYAFAAKTPSVKSVPGCLVAIAPILIVDDDARVLGVGLVVVPTVAIAVPAQAGEVQELRLDALAVAAGRFEDVQQVTPLHLVNVRQPRPDFRQVVL